MSESGADARMKEWSQFANELVAMKARAGQIGLLVTMHAMDKATQAVGWEIATKLDRKQGALANRYIDSRESSPNGEVL